MKGRIKVGIFMDSYYPAIDGVVVVIDNLAKELLEYCDVTVVVPYTNTYKDDDKKPYKIIRIKSVNIPFTEYRLGMPILSFSKEYKELVNEKFDIIHIHSPFTIGKLGIKLAEELGIPCIGTVHTRFEFEIERVNHSKTVVNKIMKEIINVYNKCDKCIVVNEPLIDEVKKYGYKYEPIVMYNGTDLVPLEEKDKEAERVNKVYGLNKDDNVLMYAGRIIDFKNIFFILDSLKLLKEDKVPFKMFYVGSGPDENKLKEQIKKYDMQDDVIMTGRVEKREELSSIYARANLLLFPSLMDTSSLVRIEAAINETPGLFIKDSMVGYTVKNNISGFTTDLDKFKYKERIKEIFDNKELLNNVSKNVKNMLDRSWSTVAEETYHLYLRELNLYEE